MKATRSVAFLILAACFTPRLLAEDEMDVGRTAAGQLKIVGDFPEPLVLDPSIFAGISGYAFAEPAFHSTILDVPSEDFFQLSFASSLRFIVVAKDAGMEVWNDTGSAFVPVGGAYFIGPPIFDTHPVWNIVSGTPGTIYTITVKVHDVNGVYTDSEPRVLSFTPGQIVLNVANGHHYERIPILPGTGIDWETANETAQAREYQGIQGHLVTITSVAEQQFLSNTFGDLTGFWFGGLQSPGSTEPSGGWKWVTGEPWSYTNWHPDQPDNNINLFNGDNEDRLIGGDVQGRWNDLAGFNDLDSAGYIVEFELCSSFVAADFDRDCDVDGDDLALFKACATAAGVAYDSRNLPAGCALTPDSGGKISPDFNKDGDVDMIDFGIFQRCYSGSNHLANSNCGQ